ncbi:arginase family protein [Lysinibacillus xylanilyticus]|uniref:arginase family protein n=1 Tax=Lysinibacillus xylanilyticus TaxID=582475 RepID=UPI00381D37CB
MFLKKEVLVIEEFNYLKLWNVKNGKIIKLENISQPQLMESMKSDNNQEYISYLNKQGFLNTEESKDFLRKSHKEFQKGFFNFPVYSLDEFYNDSLMFDSVIIGIPYDLGVVTTPGTRFGPIWLREYSWPINWSFDENLSATGFFDWTTKNELIINKRIADIGNIADPYDLNTGTREDAAFKIAHTASYIFKKAKLPVFIGGDHSITPSIIDAIPYEKIGVIQIDAHDDFSYSQSAELLHNNFINRLINNDRVKEIIQLGLRNPNRPPTNNKISTFSNVETLERINEIIENLDKTIPYYVTIDFDCLDPLYMPDTGSYVPEGFSDKELNVILEKIANSVKIIGVDFVELSPNLNSNFQLIATMVSNIILRFISNIIRRGL